MAALFGRVMPFWMGGSALLSLLLLLHFEHLNKSAWRLAAIAFAIQVFAVLFSLVGPVPINNRIIKWRAGIPPWRLASAGGPVGFDHWLRTCGLMIAFALLVLSVGIR